MALRLFIAPTSEEFRDIYIAAADAYNRRPYEERDSGFDVYCDAGDVRLITDDTVLVGQGCRALAVEALGKPRAFWLAPRSSISKSPWRLKNSLGLIDATYRGIIRAALQGSGTLTESEDRTRYCQLAAPDLLPWSDVIVVDELPAPASLRGEGGFGSTGIHAPSVEIALNDSPKHSAPAPK